VLGDNISSNKGENIMNEKQLIEGTRVKFNDCGVWLYGTLSNERVKDASGTPMIKVLGCQGSLLCGENGADMYLPIAGLKKCSDAKWNSLWWNKGDDITAEQLETHKRCKEIVKAILNEVSEKGNVAVAE
jgi:hypothetical protein